MTWWIWGLIALVCYLPFWRETFRMWHQDFTPLNWPLFFLGVVISFTVGWFVGVGLLFKRTCCKGESRGSAEKLAQWITRNEKPIEETLEGEW